MSAPDRRRIRRRAVLGLLAVLAILQLSVLVTGRETAPGGVLSGLQRPVPWAAARVQDLAAVVVGVWQTWIANVEASRELTMLRAEHERLAFALHWTEQQLADRAALDQALAWDLNPWQGTVARVVFQDPSDRFQAVWIEAAAPAADLLGHAIVADSLLLGRVVRASGRYGQVLLLRDVESSVDVVSERGVRGIVQGTGGAEARLVFVPRFEPLEVGARLHSSGRDAVFPAGFPVGIVTEVRRPPETLYLEARVRLLGDVRTAPVVRTIPPPAPGLPAHAAGP